MEIKINPEYQKLLRPLTEEEYNRLKENIRENGLTSPIVLNKNGEILDGHHRFKICNELRIEPKFIIMEFSSKLEELKFILSHNLPGRNYNDFELAEIGMKLLEIEREIAKEHMSKGGKGVPIETPLERATQQVAKQIGLSRTTFERAVKIIEDGPEEIKELCRKGELSIWNAYCIVTRSISKETEKIDLEIEEEKRHKKKERKSIPTTFPNCCPRCYMYKDCKAMTQARSEI